MKHLITIWALLIATISFGQALSPITTEFKKQEPRLYNAIRDYSVREWNPDHEMIVYETNKQVKSYLKVGLILQEDPTAKDIMVRAMRKWSNLEGRVIQTDLYNSTIDWSMVSYEMEKQVKAKNAY